MASPPTTRGRALTRAAVLLIVLLIGVWLGGHPSWLPSSLRSAFVDNSQGRLVEDVVNLISHDYYRPVNRDQLLNKGLNGAVASLNDPYSHYFTPAEWRSFMREHGPHLSGVGIEVSIERGGLRVVSLLPGSPAERAGMRPGDLIVDVNSTPLARRSGDFGSRLIRGRAGTRVNLTVMRGGQQKLFSIVRADVVASGAVVHYHGIELGDVALVNFNEGSATELRVQEPIHLHAGAKGLILDLRGNGGGLLDEGVSVASIFIPDGTIVSTAGRSQPRQVYAAKGGAISSSIPVVVLVDHGTASSAEIVTAALQDRHRAKVVGTRTYGKGVFQATQPLPNGGALDITVGEYFTPSGRNLGGGGIHEGAGVTPDVFASGNPGAPGDRALAVAERTVAAAVP